LPKKLGVKGSPTAPVEPSSFRGRVFVWQPGSFTSDPGGDGAVPTEVVAVSWLFESSGSGAPLLTDAVFSAVPSSIGVTWILTSSELKLPRLPRSQETLCADSSKEHLPSSLGKSQKLTLCGRVSSPTVFGAEVGPLLLTEIR
jgi:hypothetical protein